MRIERAKKASVAAYAICKFMESGERPQLEAYQKIGDIPTIGFGYTGKIVDKLTGQLRKLRVGKWIDGRYVDGDVITLEEAYRLFDEVAAPEAERRVDFFFPDIPLTQHQRDELFLFCYNLRWSSIADSTLRRLLNAGGWTREEIINWWVVYRNPKTQFEEGLYRRRIAELCIFFGCDHEVAEKVSWEAELRRDPVSKEIIRQTDPELILLRAETRTEAKQIAVDEVRRAATKESRPVEQPASSSPGQGEVKPVEAPPKAPVVVEPLPELPPKQTPPVAKPKPLPGQPASTGTVKDVREDPAFWTMVILVFGRVGLAMGMIPSLFTDLINDPNFRVALAGIVAIYAAMLIAWMQDRAAKRKAPQPVEEAE